MWQEIKRRVGGRVYHTSITVGITHGRIYFCLCHTIAKQIGVEPGMGANVRLLWNPESSRVLLLLGEGGYSCRPSKELHYTRQLIVRVWNGLPNNVFRTEVPWELTEHDGKPALELDLSQLKSQPTPTAQPATNSQPPRDPQRQASTTPAPCPKLVTTTPDTADELFEELDDAAMSTGFVDRSGLTAISADLGIKRWPDLMTLLEELKSRGKVRLSGIAGDFKVHII